MNRKIILAIAASAIISGIGSNGLASGDTIIQICNESGVCTQVDPTVSIIIAAVSALVDELNKDPEDRCGQNGEIMKAIAELNKASIDGLGPNNDIVRFFKQTGIDSLLKKLNINLFGTK